MQYIVDYSTAQMSKIHSMKPVIRTHSLVPDPVAATEKARLNSSQPGSSNALVDPSALTLMLDLKKINVCDFVSLFFDFLIYNFMSSYLLLLRNTLAAGLRGALFSCGCGMWGRTTMEINCACSKISSKQ